MKINYTKRNDYLIPNLKLEERQNKNINKYGLIILSYLKENKHNFYTELLMTNKLNNYLFSVGSEIENRVNNLLESYIKSDKTLTEKLKETNQLEWVSKMNNYKNMAEEFILSEYLNK